MNVLYLTRPSFFDLDLSLARALKSKVALTILIDLPPGQIKSSFLEIESERLRFLGITKCLVYSIFLEFKKYLPLDKTYIINREGKRNKLWQYFVFQFIIYRFIRNVNPDIIHCNDYLDLKYLLAIIIYRRKMVLTVHDPVPHSSDKMSWMEKCTSRINHLCIKNIIILNSTQKNEFVKKWNIKSSNIFISALGTYEYLKEYNNVKDVKNTISKPYIIFFGRIQRYKGVEYLLQAFVNLKNTFNNIDINLVIAGAGKYWFDLQPYERDDIKIINRYISTEELAKYISNSLLVACPYTDASQSGVIMSAFALGKPVVATDVGGLSEMIENGKTGMLVKPKSIREIENALSTLLSSATILCEMRKNIYNEYCVGEKSWDNICTKLTAIYSSIR